MLSKFQLDSPQMAARQALTLMLDALTPDETSIGVFPMTLNVNNVNKKKLIAFSVNVALGGDWKKAFRKSWNIKCLVH